MASRATKKRRQVYGPGGKRVHNFQTREDAERAVLDQPSRDPRALYVCKDNNGKWLITTHPEYFKDAYRVRTRDQAEE